ncbi:MAG: Rrf2 family transcriptional regulator [Candidatus Riflebacteria bacterium]|nr:Rrf2 family transcriptional regulator [Candidatus Riflebacteria bacterium]
MRLSKATLYAVNGLVTLAAMKASEPVQLKEIAEARDLPANYLAKIFGQLARAKVVRSYRGARRGFMFSRPIQEISLLEIYEAVEGPMEASDSLLEGKKVAKPAETKFFKRWDKALKAISKELESITLKDLV